MKFGDILRQKREERRMTQTDLAERIGTTQQNVKPFR